MTGRPTRYPQQRRRDPAPADASLAMRYQMPSDPLPLGPMHTHGPAPAPAADAAPEAHEARPDGERGRLLARIVNASVPSRLLCTLIVECEGIAAFSDSALRRMGRILDIIEHKPERKE